MTGAVVFDLDGTLIDSLPDVTNAVNRMLADHGCPPLSQETVTGFVGMGERVLLERVIAATDLNSDDYDALLKSLLGHYVNCTNDTRLFAHVRDTLRVLRKSGFALGICTNKPSGPLSAVLDALDLQTEFGAVIAGDTLPTRKPNPASLYLAYEQLAATEGVYVGDSDVDAETARRAGIPFALFTEGIRTKPIEYIPHDAVFDDFQQLPGIVDHLMRPLPKRQ